MSTKFALHAGVLVFAARIEMHSIDAILDPSIPVSVASEEVIHRLNAALDSSETQIIRKNRVIGIDHSEVRLHAIRAGKVDGAAMIVGNDVLRGAPLMLDFGRDHLRLLERSEARRIEAGMTAVPMTVTDDGCLSLAAHDETGAPVSVALVGDDRDSQEGRTDPPKSVRIADLSAQASLHDGARCHANRATIGWDAFRGRRILIDFAAGKLWVDRSGRS